MSKHSLINQGTFTKQELNSPLYFDPPKDIATLTKRLNLILGRSIGELATIAKVALPESNLACKGISGQLIEIFLGANAHNLSEPDFINLQIELKTLPVNQDLVPQESTFICSADINPERFILFERSALYHKLKHVLFVLLQAPKGLAIKDRRIIGYFFYQPSKEELELIATDYNEFCELIFSSQARNINGSLGNIIQMRPKAANSNVFTPIRDNQGQTTYVSPKGYYLRARYTKQLVAYFVKNNYSSLPATSNS